MKQRLKKILCAAFIAGVMVVLAGTVFIRWGNGIARAVENNKPSRSIGTTKDGRLVNGKRLPTSGPNFTAYGYLPVAFGRNSLNDRVRSVVLDAYGTVERSYPWFRHDQHYHVDFENPDEEQTGQPTHAGDGNHTPEK